MITRPTLCALVAPVIAISTVRADTAAFNYGPLGSPIVSASFTMDVAELNANEFVAGSQVNLVHLIDVTTGLPDADLSGMLFGGTSFPAPPTINLGPTQTALISAPISPGFFPALMGGSLGLWAILTDTRDGVFAIDTLELNITTTTGSITALYGSPNDGYGIGVPDNGNLPAPLPGGLTANGTGFDEPVTSKSIYKVPEPSPLWLLLGGLSFWALASRRRLRQVRLTPGLRQRRALAVVATAGALAGTSFADIKINEIMYAENSASPDPNVSQEWVELHNTGPGSVNLSGWALSNRGGLAGSPFYRNLPSYTLPPNAYLVVYFGIGIDDTDFSDGKGSYHTGDPLGINFYNFDMDEAGLYSPGGIVDFLAWDRTGAGYTPGTAATEAVAANIWHYGRFIQSSRIALRHGDKFRTISPGHSLGRNKAGADTDDPNDWDQDGGAAEPTPGLADLGFLPFVPDIGNDGYPGDPSDPNDPNSPPTIKKWTLILYMDADNSLESEMYHDVVELQDAGGTNADVNVVVIFDGLDAAIEASIDAAGDIDGADGLTIGGTWRFEVGPPPAGGQDYILMRTHNGDNPYLGEENMGDPATLTDFIKWSKDHYPAERYALFINDHGLGWKGSTGDDSEVPEDALYMGEIRSALAAAGLHFDLIAFDECLMGMIEIAYQVEPYCSYFLGSQETISGDGYPYDDVLTDLKANVNWDGGQFGSDIVDQFHDYYTNTVADENHTLACVDENALIALVQAVDGMAGELKDACADFRAHDDPDDNVEERIRIDAIDREIYAAQATGIVENPLDPNELAALLDTEFDYMDLCHFARNIADDPGIPECYKDHAREISGGECLMGVIVNEAHGDGHPEAHGLNIYFPPQRTTDGPDTLAQILGFEYAGDPAVVTYSCYDYPEFSRETNGNSRRAMYAPNADCLPHAARDVESGAALAAPAQWPLVPTPNFAFPADTQWDEFLQRFYHPVADNHILQGFCPCGQVVYPEVSDPECGNPIDEITILCGWFVQFSGQGSSDADTEDFLPTHWMWDFDDHAKGCTACIGPDEVPAGDDAADADDNMNADQDCNKAPLDDEKEADEDTTTHQYNLPGDFVVHLNVWDDNHEFDFHDTVPSADYVHTQTATHTSIVHVVCPDQLHVVGPFPNTPTVGSSTLSQALVEDNFVGLRNVPVIFTDMLGNIMFNNGSGAGSHATTLMTDNTGNAGVLYTGQTASIGLIQATVPGTPLTTFIFLEFTNPRPIIVPTHPIPTKVQPNGVGHPVEEVP